MLHMKRLRWGTKMPKKDELIESVVAILKETLGVKKTKHVFAVAIEWEEAFPAIIATIADSKVFTRKEWKKITDSNPIYVFSEENMTAEALVQTLKENYPNHNAMVIGIKNQAYADTIAKHL